MAHSPIGAHPAVSPLSAVLEAAFPRAARTPAECRFSSSLLRCCRRWAVATEAELLLALAADPPRAARCILSERTEHIERTEDTGRTEPTVCPVRVDAIAAQHYISSLLRALCLRRVASSAPVCPVSRLFSSSCAAEFFTTGCARLDALLCGGLRGGALTELHGEAGSGKTQLALQALVHAAGRGGAAALCLAAEDIPCARLKQLVAAQAQSAEQAERVMAAVRIRRVAGLRDVIRMLRDGSLRAAFRAGGGRGVVVIDSIAAAAAQDSTEFTESKESKDSRDSRDSTDAIADAGALLKAFAVEERAAVVATNQVRALLPHHSGRGGAEGPRPLVPHAAGAVAPALGIQWAVAPHVRVRLRRLAPALAARQLTVLSGPAHPPLSGTFIIDKDGIRAEG